MHKVASSESSTHSIKGATVPAATIAEIDELRKDIQDLNTIKVE